MKQFKSANLQVGKGATARAPAQLTIHSSWNVIVQVSKFAGKEGGKRFARAPAQLTIHWGLNIQIQVVGNLR